MEKRVSGFIVGPIWSEFMKYAVAQLPNMAFARTETPTTGLKPVLRGVWQGSNTHVDNNLEYATQEVHSILHWVDKNNPTGPIPQNPGNDPQYVLWEAPVRGWALINRYEDGDEVPVGSAQQISSDPEEEEPEENN